MEKIKVDSYTCVEDNFDDFVDGKKMGEIELAVPVANINAWHGTRLSKYALIAGISQIELEQILYYAKSVVTSGSMLPIGAVVSDEELRIPLQKDLGLNVRSGLPGVLFLLDRVDTKEILSEARRAETEYMQKAEEIHTALDSLPDDEELSYTENEDKAEDEETAEEDIDPNREKRNALESELQELYGKLKHTRMLIDAALFIEKHKYTKFEIRKLELFPLKLRTALQEAAEAAPYGVYSDIERFCENIANQNSRTKKLIDLKAPEVIIRNESRMLQEAVDALINNGKRGEPKTWSDADHAPVSLSDLFLEGMPF